MKKKLISLLFLSFGFIPLTSLGQISSGTTLLSGSLNYNSNSYRLNSNDDQVVKSNNFAFTPKAGYFVSNNLVIGAGLGLNTAKQKNFTTINSKVFGYSIGPFVRYYKFLGEKTALFGDAAINYAHNKAKALDSNQEFVPAYINENISASITPGFTYFASSRIGLEISLGYLGYSKTLTERNMNTADYYKNTNSGFVKYYGLANSALGVNFYLGR